MYVWMYVPTTYVAICMQVDICDQFIPMLYARFMFLGCWHCFQVNIGPVSSKSSRGSELLSGHELLLYLLGTSFISLV